MANPISLKWNKGGDWDGLMRGGRTSATACIVSRTEISGNEATVYLQSNDGLIEEGDAVQNGLRYYTITEVDIDDTVVNWFKLDIDSRFEIYQTNASIIV